MFSDQFFRDDTPEGGLGEIFRTFMEMGKNFGKTIADGYRWSDPASNPLGDLQEAMKVSYERGNLHTGGLSVDIGLGTYSYWRGTDPSQTIFDEPQTYDTGGPALTPTDGMGRPMLDETGGMVRRREAVCRRGHGQLEPGGYCKRCR